jgi:AraC-like DNA-binding protein
MEDPGDLTTSDFYLKAEFDDFDQVAEAVEGWDLDWQQLDRGQLEASVQQIGSAFWLLSRVGFSRQFHQRGATPRGFLTFGLPGRTVDEVNWCGHSADGRNLLVFRPGGEYESMSLPGFRANTLSFSEDLLDAAALSLDLPRVGRLVSGSHQVFVGDPALLAKMRGVLRRIFHAVAEDRSALAKPGLRSDVEIELPKLLLESLVSGRASSRRRSSAVRSRAARQALALIAEASDAPLTVGEVCRSVGVSERTLRYAFREQLGVSPKQYLQLVRLGGVRRDFQLAAPGAKIADVANRWGFWHLGQFAADYRRQFGELPSETLARH